MRLILGKYDRKTIESLKKINEESLVNKNPIQLTSSIVFYFDMFKDANQPKSITQESILKDDETVHKKQKERKAILKSQTQV